MKSLRILTTAGILALSVMPLEAAAHPAQPGPSALRALAAPGAQNIPYGFSYRFIGPNPRVYPIQAFAGRHSLYVQFPSTVIPKMAMTFQNRRYVKALLLREGPYYAVIPSSARTLIVTDRGRVTLQRSGGPARPKPAAHQDSVRVTVVPATLGSSKTHAGSANTSGRASATIHMLVSLPPKPKMLTLRMTANSRISRDLAGFLHRQGWSLAWNATEDYAVRYAFVVRGPTVRAVLHHIIALYPLRIRLYAGNKVVAVTLANSLHGRMPAHVH